MKNHLWIPSIERYTQAAVQLNAEFEERDDSVASVIESDARHLPKLLKINLAMLARDMAKEGESDETLRARMRALGLGAYTTALVCEKAYGSLYFVDAIKHLEVGYGLEGASHADQVLGAYEHAEESLNVLGPVAHEWIKRRRDEVTIEESEKHMFIIGAGRAVDNIHGVSKILKWVATQRTI